MRNNNIFHMGFVLITSVMLASCENETEGVSPHAQIYMPQAVDRPSEHVLVLKDSAQALVFGGAYGSPDVLNLDMDIEFEVSPDLVDAFNLDRGTDFEMMPEGTFELSNDRVGIVAGQMQSEPLKVWVNPGQGFDFETQYLLPISIKSAEGGLPINESLRTTYFLVEALPPVYDAFDRSGWSIYDVSSEEVVGEGENNGNAKHTLDDDIGTFWHTQWYGASPGLPHIITVDMGESKLINGFSFIQRQNRGSGNVNELFIELSEDGENWTQVEIFPGSLPNDNNNNPVFLSSSSNARYFRVTITSTYGDTNFTHLAEIYAF